LVIPLAVLTFFGGFIPIIGAFVAGAFAVLIALVSKGFTTALIVLIIVVLVQQIEGNVLQPIIQGRGFNLHAAVVILAVTAGSSLAGIIGAFLSVPIAALIAVVYRYVRDELDGKEPEIQDDGTRARLAGDDSGTAVLHDPVGAPGEAADESGQER
jgi:predicted PurR-regulated permease PerM